VAAALRTQLRQDRATHAVRAVTTILAARRPALHYPRATLVQRAFVAARPFLPQALAEFLVRDTYGLR
jgi:hypothetical protein